MRKLKIYLDNCCFNRPYDDQTQVKVSFETQAKLYIQELVLKKEIQLVWSYILKFENSKNIFLGKKKAIAEWEYLSTLFIGKSDSQLVLAKDIMLSGLKSFDALHIACAIIAECDYFITVDKRILRYCDERIKIYNPIEFVNDYGEDTL